MKTPRITGLAMLLAGCPAKDDATTAAETSGTVSSSSSADTSTGTAPLDCESILDEASCHAPGEGSEAMRCQWIERFLAGTPDGSGSACGRTSLGGTCLEFAYQGEGCGYSDPPYASCDTDTPFPWRYRLEGDEWVFVEDICEWYPIGFTQCWSDPNGEPPACECVCLP